MHFQSCGAWGRIVHLQPVTWKDGWPLIGVDINKDGIGEPVVEWNKPNVGLFAVNPKIETGVDYADFEFFRLR